MLRNKKRTEEQKKEVDYEQLGHMLANIYETGYVNRNQSYKMSFIKGLLGGLGGVLGATIVVGLMLWLLSVLQNVPLLDRAYDNFRDTIQTRQNP